MNAFARMPLGQRRTAGFAVGSLVTAALATIACLAAAEVAVNHSGRVRLLCAVLLLILFVFLFAANMSAGVLALFVFLPFLALTRRLLIPVAPWSSYDPMLLVSPVLASLVFLHLFTRAGRPLAPDRLSKFVLALLVITVAESVNPNSGSLLTGVGGLLFTAIPLLWFFIGRELVDRATLLRIYVAVAVIACIVAGYGLDQTTRGLPSWDASWVNITGYAALQVGGVRPFGTMSSSAEYAFYLAVAIMICVAAFVRLNIFAILPIPLLATALFLESSRGVVVLAVAATFALIGLRSGSGIAMLFTVAAGVALVGFGVHAHSASIQASATATQSRLVTHQIGGILHPLSSSNSTLPTKIHQIGDGIRTASSLPFGYGTGVTNLASARFGGRTAGGENDLAGTLVSFGFVGAAVFLAIVILTLRRVVAYYRRTDDGVGLAVAGILFVTLGQWFNGGYYAVAPLIWLSIGWIVGQTRALDERAA